MPTFFNMKRGFSLTELIVYVAITSVVFVVVSGGVVDIAKLFARARAERKVALAAETALERITREIRLACPGTTVTSSPPTTKISLKTFTSSAGPCDGDDAPPTTTRDIEFNATAQTLKFAGESLVPGDVKVTAGTFSEISGSSYRAIRVDLTFTSGAVSRRYYSMATLRGSY